MINNPNISWDDIAGLDAAKKAIQELVIWPMLRPCVGPLRTRKAPLAPPALRFRRLTTPPPPPPLCAPQRHFHWPAVHAKGRFALWPAGHRQDADWQVHCQPVQGNLFQHLRLVADVQMGA